MRDIEVKAHFERMAAYNDRDNRRRYAAALDLSGAEYQTDLGAFFGAVHATLNHRPVGNLIWLAWFQGDPAPRLALSDKPHDNRNALWQTRRAADQDIIGCISALAQEFTYTMATRPDRVSQPRGSDLAHFFNHQTQHRGQAPALPTLLRGAAPVLGLVHLQRVVA